MRDQLVHTNSCETYYIHTNHVSEEIEVELLMTVVPETMSQIK